MHRLLIGATCVSVFTTAWLLTGQGETSGSRAAILQAGIQASAQGQAETTPLRVQVPPPPFSEGIFPCSDCHNEKDLPTNPVRRTLVDAHDDIDARQVVASQWLRACIRAAPLGRAMLAAWRNSPLRKLAGGGSRANLDLGMLSLLKLDYRSPVFSSLRRLGLSA